MTTTREEAIEMAREAGFFTDKRILTPYMYADVDLSEHIIRLIDLARAKENEACAKVCDKAADEAETFGYRAVHHAIAKRIRARMK